MTEDEREKLFFDGIEQFNKQEFFDCHETLEHLWTHDRSDERELMQGVIQIAVGYYHFLRENHVGALKLLRRGLERVKKYEPRCMSLNIQKFAKDVSVNIEEIDRMETGTHGTINIPQIELERD